MKDELRSISFGDLDVPVIAREWRSAPGVVGYRKIYRLHPGELWVDAPVSGNQYEHLALIDGRPLPVGVAIAAELMREGVDWAYCTEMWTRVVLLDHNARCVAVAGPTEELLERLRNANDGSLSGLTDVIAVRGDDVILREAKRVGRDRIQKQQHRFASAAQRFLGDSLDLAVVEWDPPQPTGTDDEFARPSRSNGEWPGKAR
jgi:hypothetical protein